MITTTYALHLMCLTIVALLVARNCVRTQFPMGDIFTDGHDKCGDIYNILHIFHYFNFKSQIFFSRVQLCDKILIGKINLRN